MQTNFHTRASARSLVAVFAGVLVLIIGAAATPVRAESILLVVDSVTPSGPNFEWKYKVELSTLSEIWKGPSGANDVYSPDFVELFDFGPTVGTPTFTASAAGFSNSDFVVTEPNDDYVATTAVFGYGAGELLDDDAGIQNIRLTFDNGTPFVNPGAGTLQLGTLSAISVNNSPLFDTYIATDTKPSGESGKNSATIQVPTVPEPTTMVGLVVLGALAVARRAGRRA